MSGIVPEPGSRSIDPCPVCGAGVDVVTATDGVGSWTEPCGHRVEVTIWPGGRCELARYVPDPPPPAPDDLSGLEDAEAPDVKAGRLSGLLARAVRTMPGGPPLELMAPLLATMTEALRDAEVLGAGWIRVNPPGQGMPPLERIDPARLYVVDEAAK